MLWKYLTDSWNFFRNHFLAIGFIILPIVVPIEIFTLICYNFDVKEEFEFSNFAIPMIISFIASPIYKIGVIFYIASIISEKNIDTKTLWKLGVKFWWPYIILILLVGLAVIFGFLFLVIPGIIFAIRYAFAEFDLLLNNSKPIDAIRNSWYLTKDYMWVIIGGYIIISLLLFTPYFLIASLTNEGSIAYMVLDTVSNIIFSVLMVLYTIFTFRVYDFSKLQHNKI